MVEPFEVEQHSDRFADANVGKHRPAGVEDQAGKDLRQAVGERLLDDATVTHRRHVVGGLPAAGIGLGADVVEALLEGLQMRIAVTIEIEADFVEIPQAPVDGKVASPIVGIALQCDAAAGIDLGDHIGTAADDGIECGVLEGIGIDGVLGQHRHQAKDQRQLAIVGAGQVEADHTFG